MQEFMNYIDESIQKLEQEEQVLANTDRKDEANLVKIRINIYGICKTILNVVTKGQSPTGQSLAGQSAQILDAAWKDAYVQKLTQLPKNWKASYEKAKEHNDVEKLVIEEIKLETLEEIKRKFRDICEE